MYAIIFTGILIVLICSLYRGICRRFIFQLYFPVAGKSSVIICLIAGLIFVHNNSFAQSRNNKAKLGLVKVKSPAFKKKKQRQTASFTGKGYDSNTPGGPVGPRSEMSSYTGTGIRVSKLKNNTTDPKKAAAYRTTKALKPGRNPMGEQIARRADPYRGSDLVKSDYKKRKDARRRNKKFSQFEGAVVRGPAAQKKYARNKSEEISKYRGDLIVKKMPKGAHPSAAWRGGKVKNSYQQKEKYRKRMMKKIGRNKNKMQPNYLRKKNREEKPTYDSRESDIWLKPR